AAGEVVGAAGSVDRVVAGAAVDRVVAAGGRRAPELRLHAAVVAEDRVVATQRPDHVVAEQAADRLAGGRAGDRVIVVRGAERERRHHAVAVLVDRVAGDLDRAG